MKNSLLIVLLAVGVASCGSKSKEVDTVAGENTSVSNSHDFKIGYYESDSIVSSFDYYKNESKVLEERGNRLQNEMAGLQGALEAKANEYNRGLQSNSLSPNQRAAFEEKLGRMQNELVNFQQTKLAQFQQDQMNSTEVLTNKVAQYEASFAKSQGLTLFLAKAKGSAVAYVDTTMDMTAKFMEYMNQEESKLNSAE